MTSRWKETLLSLIARTSTDLPADVRDALSRARDAEEAPNARATLDTMLTNADLACRDRRPLCQDTGTLLFWITVPAGSIGQTDFREAAEEAIVQATEEGILRQNCVETFSGRNTGNNLGKGSPVIHWDEHDQDTVRVDLILKGGGCENVGRQYALPDFELEAGRDLEGVRRCVLDALVKAQGRGCAPGILGVAVGGDRATGYDESKRLFLRNIGQRSTIPEVADLERQLLEEGNSLGIGPMGFGGHTTLLDVFVGFRSRLPASYFVSISYMCWAYRRRSVIAAIDGTPVEEI